MPIEFLNRGTAPALAYQKDDGVASSLPTVVFLHGLWSDMEGTKALYLSDYCKMRGQKFIRFDCRGHGKSGGDFKDATIGLWRDDARDIIDTLTDGKLILVGSSMGGWLALLVALARPERISGLIGLAAAPDFTNEISNRMTAEHCAQLLQDGFFDLHNIDGFPTMVTQKLLKDGEDHCLLAGPIPITAPVYLMQGMQDDDVPWQTAHRLAKAIGDNAQVFLREHGDHRLSDAGDLDFLGSLVGKIATV